MAAIHRMIERLAARVLAMIKMVRVVRTGIKKFAVAKVIEFYVPKHFRKQMRRVSPIERGKIIECCLPTRKSA
jgi:hypothetical protein